MLSITPNFTSADIRKDFEELEAGIKMDIVRALYESLQRMVDEARAKTKADGGFGNVTWNLRASIGGVIMMDGQIVETYFPPISKGNEGAQKGLIYATDIAHLQNDGEIILVFVAGMDYAFLVEARDDTDVITGSSDKFEQFFKAAIER